MTKSFEEQLRELMCSPNKEPTLEERFKQIYEEESRFKFIDCLKKGAMIFVVTASAYIGYEAGCYKTRQDWNEYMQTVRQVEQMHKDYDKMIEKLGK